MVALSGTGFGGINAEPKGTFYLRNSGIEDAPFNSQNIGSIFIREVDHSDAKKVTIHDYEIVRNDATDTHNATHDWLEVDRATGKVRSTIFE
jgi:hypothetical protein